MMKKLLLLTLGLIRILWDCCPWCNSSAPGIDLCPICDGIGRDLRELPPSKELKKKWWIRFKYRVRMETTKPSEPTGPTKQPGYSYECGPTGPAPPAGFTGRAMEQLIKEYILPGLKNYQIKHGFYPPHEARFLRKIFYRPGSFPEDEWNEVLKRVGEEIKKLDESQR